MAKLIGQVTIPASGKVQLGTDLNPQTGGPGNLAANIVPSAIYVQQLQVQNNGVSATNMRLGDQSVTATRGILLFPSSSDNLGAFINYGSYLNDWFVFGTPGDVVDYLFIQ
jgi:hypothetical protein